VASGRCGPFNGLLGYKFLPGSDIFSTGGPKWPKIARYKVWGSKGALLCKLFSRGCSAHANCYRGAAAARDPGPLLSCAWPARFTCCIRHRTVWRSQPGLKKPLGKPRFTTVTGLTGPDRFRSGPVPVRSGPGQVRSGPVRYSPNLNLKFKKNAEKIPKNSS
jgi:hypothetical protein